MSGDEQFFAWLDGELSEREAEEVAARVRADPRLGRLAERHRAMGSRLKGTFDTVMDQPVPPAIAAAAREPSADVVQLPLRRSWSGTPVQWLSLAATLAAGVLIGTLVPRTDHSPVELRGDAIYAAAGLAEALDHQLASAPASGPVRMGVTFRNQSGAICRTFNQAHSSGLACREDGAWKVRGFFAAPEGQAGDYRMAAGTDPQLAALVGSMIVGEPFDAPLERAAKERGWR